MKPYRARDETLQSKQEQGDNSREYGVGNL